MRTSTRIAVFGLLLSLTPAAGLRAQEEDPLAGEEVSRPGETVDQADARAREAIAASSMRITVSTVGFDIPPGSEAERYLQGTARAGGGGYFTANNAGELASAMGAAASGQAPGQTAAGPEKILITAPREGEVVGPSVVVTGKALPNGLVVLYTICSPEGTDLGPKFVPGTRQRATSTGDFSFRIAAPRVSFGDRVPVRYAVHAYLLHDDGTKGPETVVNLRSPELAVTP